MQSTQLTPRLPRTSVGQNNGNSRIPHQVLTQNNHHDNAGNLQQQQQQKTTTTPITHAVNDNQIVTNNSSKLSPTLQNYQSRQAYLKQKSSPSEHNHHNLTPSLQQQQQKHIASTPCNIITNTNSRHQLSNEANIDDNEEERRKRYLTFNKEQVSSHVKSLKAELCKQNNNNNSDNSYNNVTNNTGNTNKSKYHSSATASAKVIEQKYKKNTCESKQQPLVRHFISVRNNQKTDINIEQKHIQCQQESSDKTTCNASNETSTTVISSSPNQVKQSSIRKPKPLEKFSKLPQQQQQQSNFARVFPSPRNSLDETKSSPNLDNYSSFFNADNQINNKKQKLLAKTSADLSVKNDAIINSNASFRSQPVCEAFIMTGQSMMKLSTNENEPQQQQPLATTQQSNEKTTAKTNANNEINGTQSTVQAQRDISASLNRLNPSASVSNTNSTTSSGASSQLTGIRSSQLYDRQPSDSKNNFSNDLSDYHQNNNDINPKPRGVNTVNSYGQEVNSNNEGDCSIRRRAFMADVASNPDRMVTPGQSHSHSNAHELASIIWAQQQQQQRQQQQSHLQQQQHKANRELDDEIVGNGRRHQHALEENVAHKIGNNSGALQGSNKSSPERIPQFQQLHQHQQQQQQQQQHLQYNLKGQNNVIECETDCPQNQQQQQQQTQMFDKRYTINTQSSSPMKNNSSSMVTETNDDQRDHHNANFDISPLVNDNNHRDQQQKVDNTNLIMSDQADRDSARRLAKRLYNLSGFKRSDVCHHLAKNNPFSFMVAEEYLKLFDFRSMKLDAALRKFLSKLQLNGETQERERALSQFSLRYYDCNKDKFPNSDTVQTLVCAIILLNTDLHGYQSDRKFSKRGTFGNKRAKLSLGAWIDGLNNSLKAQGGNGQSANIIGQYTSSSLSGNISIDNETNMPSEYTFPRHLLVELYEAIKKRPLKCGEDKCDMSSYEVELDKLYGQQFGNSNNSKSNTLPTRRFAPGTNAPSSTMSNSSRRQLKSGLNKLNRLEDQSDFSIEFKRGFLSRKRIYDTQGRPTPRGRRSWRKVFVILQDLRLILRYDYEPPQQDMVENENNTDSLSRDTKLNKRQQAQAKQKEKQLVAQDVKNTLRLHHSMAKRADGYTKREYVFHLILADQSELLLQATSETEMNLWIDTINFASACLSSPALPSAVSNCKRYQKQRQRPILPASYTKLSYWEQLVDHEERLKRFKLDLDEHINEAPQATNADKRVKSDFIDKIAFLKHEIERYVIYVELMRKKSNSPEAIILSKHPQIASLTPSDEMIKLLPSFAPAQKLAEDFIDEDKASESLSQNGS